MKIDNVIPQDDLLLEDLRKLISKDKFSVTELSNKLQTYPAKIRELLIKLEGKGYNLKTVEDNEKISIVKSNTGKTVLIENYYGEEIRFGVVSDTHLVSFDDRLSKLNEYYEICRQQEISIVYHAGNIVDGTKAYPGHENELRVQGFDKQLEYCINEYPNVKGITTKFIASSTSHEGSWFKREGLLIGPKIQEARSDMEYIGLDEADVTWDSMNIVMKIMHPGAGSAYALSYRGQKIVESFTGGDKPNILVLGHFHKAGWFIIRNVHVLLAGCFQNQTPFMRKRSLEAMKGGYIITLKIGEDKRSIVRFVPEFFPIYD